MPMNRKEYPDNWEWLSKQIRKRNKGRCELCFAPNGKRVSRDPDWIYPWCYDVLSNEKDVKIILTVHHIDGNKQNNSEQNLISLCQRCHLRLDIEKHMRKRKRRLGNL